MNEFMDHCSRVRVARFALSLVICPFTDDIHNYSRFIHGGFTFVVYNLCNDC
jgi:hypothetical protein